METMDFIITNNLMAGLTLKAIEEIIPCFINTSNADLENLEEAIEITISCRKEDANFVKNALAPFV